jgi:hypothetical protein
LGNKEQEIGGKTDFESHSRPCLLKYPLVSSSVLDHCPSLAICTPFPLVINQYSLSRFIYPEWLSFGQLRPKEKAKRVIIGLLQAHITFNIATMLGEK